MSTQNADRLYDLLPAVHRLRDADRGYPLRALLQVISEQVNHRRRRYRPALRKLVHRNLSGLGRSVHRRLGWIHAAVRLTSRAEFRSRARWTANAF